MISWFRNRTFFCKAYFILLAVISMNSTSQADESWRLSGFGSIVAGHVVDGHGYVADYPNVGIYDDQADLTKESKLGVQARSQLTEDLTFTAQLIARAVTDYDPVFDWVFVNYALLPDLEIQAGKLRVPLYYYSEYMDVGFAFPWVRVPADTYSLDLTHFNGAQLNGRHFLGAMSVTTTLFLGRQNNDNDALMSYLFDQNIDREFTGLAGAGLEVNYADTTVKLTYAEADMIEQGSVWGQREYAIRFYDIYVQQALGALVLLGEYNQYEPFYESYFVSPTYRMGSVTYYLLYSKFDLDTPYEEHETASLGLRYEYSPKTAIKLDFSRLTDEGVDPITDTPNPVNNAPDGDGDVSIVSVSLDFIF